MRSFHVDLNINSMRRNQKLRLVQSVPIPEDAVKDSKHYCRERVFAELTCGPRDRPREKKARFCRELDGLPRRMKKY